jgi:hypothetical protein
MVIREKFFDFFSIQSRPSSGRNNPSEGTRFTQVQTPHRSHCDAHDTALTGSIDQETWAQRMV